MNKPVALKGMRIITISGRIGSGASTLASHLSKTIHWPSLEGGQLFRAFTKDHGFAGKRLDDFDLAYEEKVKHILEKQSQQIIESHLAGFDAQGIAGVFKILVVCEDEDGTDKTDIRIDRLVNRDKATVDSAKHEVLERETQNLAKWQRLYVNNDSDWVYWDKKYYDLVINTYSFNPEESLNMVLEAIAYKNPEQQ
jgi:cytidylate kinase